MLFKQQLHHHRRSQNLHHLDSSMGLKLGGSSDFSRNLNNRGSSGAYVTCICYSFSVKINPRKTPYGAQRSWTHFVLRLFFAYVGGKKPEDPQFEPYGWWRHYTGQHRRFGMFRVYLWVTPRHTQAICFNSFLTGHSVNSLFIWKHFSILFL